MKDILISIRPQWVEKIASGEKTIEVRKTKPKLETPFKCLIYCTIARKNRQPLLIYKDGTVCFGDYRNACTCDANGGVDCYIDNGKVIGEFVCDKIFPMKACLDDHGSADLGAVKTVEFFLPAETSFALREKTGLKLDELFDCIGNGNWGYGWRISNLKIYDRPKELRKFGIVCRWAEYVDCEPYDGWYCRDEACGEDCEYFDCPSCGGESNEYEDFAYCMCNGLPPLKKPPISWCYVKERVSK